MNDGINHEKIMKQHAVFVYALIPLCLMHYQRLLNKIRNRQHPKEFIFSVFSDF